jgi:hypothetical protein
VFWKGQSGLWLEDAHQTTFCYCMAWFVKVQVETGGNGNDLCRRPVCAARWWQTLVVALHVGRLGKAERKRKVVDNLEGLNGESVRQLQ